MIDRGITPDTLTDQTSAHDELIGYFPAGMSVEEANILRERDPVSYTHLTLPTKA